MNISMRLVALTLLINGLSSYADANSVFEVVKCPAIGDEYVKMIADLDAIKASIKTTGNCDKVLKNVDAMSKLVQADRDKVLAILNKANGGELTADEAGVVRTYAESVTKKVSNLTDLFMNSNQCFDEDAAPNQLSSLAGFVGEASTFLGSVSGPWGAPISLAGNVIAGFLTGLDQVLKSRNGYDFTNRAQWKNYVQNLCTYHSYRDQLDRLLNPQSYIRQLESLRNRLDQQLVMMAGKCEECKSIMASGSLNDVDLGRQVENANRRFRQPLGSYTVQSLGLKTWIQEQVTQTEKESQGIWGEATGQFLLTKTRNQIEGFLINQSAPQFLAYQMGESRRAFTGDFLSFAGQEGIVIYNGIWSRNPEAVQPLKSAWFTTNPLAVFTALVVQPIAWDRLPQDNATSDLADSWSYYRDQSVDLLRASVTSARVAQNFCGFFKLAGFFSREIRETCNSQQFKYLTDALSKVAKEVADSTQPATTLRFGEVEPEKFLPNKTYVGTSIERLNKTIEARQQLIQ